MRLQKVVTVETVFCDVCGDDITNDKAIKDFAADGKLNDICSGTSSVNGKNCYAKFIGAKKNINESR